MLAYPVFQTPTPSINPLDLEAGTWANSAVLEVDHFRPESSDHRPRTQARLMHDGRCLFGVFTVQDRYVRCVHTEFQSRTHRDSCVEIFLQPDRERGYFNFEFNCGGTLAVFYITNPTRTEDLFQEYVKLSAADVEGLQVISSLPAIIEPEIATPLEWRLGFAIPLTVLEPYCGALGSLHGRTWRGNVYKCGDETSHPHWAAWSPVPELNFHMPQAFGEFRFL